MVTVGLEVEAYFVRWGPVFTGWTVNSQIGRHDPKDDGADPAYSIFSWLLQFSIACIWEFECVPEESTMFVNAWHFFLACSEVASIP